MLRHNAKHDKKKGELKHRSRNFLCYAKNTVCFVFILTGPMHPCSVLDTQPEGTREMGYIKMKLRRLKINTLLN